MAQFTRLLRDIVKEREGIGLDRYPIFDENYRATLNDKIVTHYYMREVGYEDDDYFIFALRRKMSEIMPYYNQIYKSTLLEFDPMLTVDMRTIASQDGIRETDTASVADQTSTTSSTSRAVNSTTPQTLLSENGQYASAIADSTSETKGSEDAKNSGTSNEHSTASNEGRQYGRSMSGPQILAELRATFVNTDMLVIDELSELFMSIWGSSDNMSGRGSVGVNSTPGYPLFFM